MLGGVILFPRVRCWIVWDPMSQRNCELVGTEIKELYAEWQGKGLFWRGWIGQKQLE